MTDMLPRTLVPTTRQGAIPDLVDEAESGHTKLSRKAAAGRYLRDLDPRQIKGPRRPYIVLGLLLLITDVDQQVYTLALPDLRAAFAVSVAALIVIPNILTNVGIIIRPLIGFLSDRIPRVLLLRVAFIGKSLVLTLTAFAGGLGQIVSGISAANLVNQIQGPSQQTLVADYYEPESRGRVLSLIPAMTGLGFVIGPLIGGFFLHTFGWRAAVLVLGIFSIVVASSSLLLKEPERGGIDRRLGLEAPAEETQTPSFSDGFRILNRIDTVRRIWYSTPFLAAGAGAVQIFLNVYFVDRFALTDVQRSFIFSLGGVGTFIGFVAVAPAAGRLLASQPGKVMTLAGSFYSVIVVGCLLIMQSTHILFLATIASLPIQFSFALFVMAPGLVLVQVVPASIRGLGVTSPSFWQMLSLPLLFIGGISITSSQFGPGTLAAVMIPMFFIGGVIFSSGAASIANDTRTALAASVAAEEIRRARTSGRSRLLLCRDVEVKYDGAQVLFGVDFDVDEGEMVALIGTNGAGKSTLLRAIAGTQRTSSGAILLNGEDIGRESPHVIAGKGAVMVPGGHAIFPRLTVAENLRIAGWLHKNDPARVAKETAEVLELFPVLTGKLDRLAGELSGGEQQMVALGQALLMAPKLLLVDELSLGLAPSVVEKLLDILRRIHANGTTVVLVEQSLNVALTLADRAVFLDKGKVRFDGPTEALLARPDLIRSVFLGGAVSARSTVSMQRARTAGTVALELRDITVNYGGVQALDNANLTVGRGELVGVIGPNGAGKTTLFDVASGFASIDSGSVVIDGIDATAMSPDGRARAGLGRSFQNVRLFGSMTVRDNIAVAFERHAVRSATMALLWLPSVRQSEAKIFRRVDDLIAVLGLGAFANKFVSELSTGSRRAVEVACVMAAEPKALLLDEPSSGLAQAEVEALGPLLQRLVRDTGCGLVIIEHDLPLISFIADRFVAMELGTVIATGIPSEVLSDPRVVRAYLNASPDVLARSGDRMASIVSSVLDADDEISTPQKHRSTTTTKK